ncbi:MAG: hypothetical protein Q8L04_07705 [Ignavibacteria bacterium]|nr:MAG: hypothetical protein FD122_74 [Stygiobacter sp.]KAF0162281.1 MAG: hypothetical protein FD188_235 [Ignavibacteria bacterium]KAF0217166.1 MAG: hypothetical protein FD178_702 [Ignavibacteria bacterium]MDP2037253.1 hypothetical protein [Ignavibacteria bacterium]
MEKVVRKISLKDKRNYDLEYWLSKTPEERIAAIEFLRKQTYETKDGSSPRLQRTVKVIKRKQG